jgi:predicted amidophosphoribosyltransferase
LKGYRAYGEACVQCGSEQCVTVRGDCYETSEPLCANCWYEFDHLGDRIYCDMQFAFYNQEDE